MEWYQIVMAAGIPSLISGLILLKINRMLARNEANRKALEEARLKRDRKITAQNEAMEKQNAALMKGVQAMLRDRLLQGYRHYKEKGWADYEDRLNLENIYEQYHNLGANGIMDGYRKEFLELPTNK